jgi:hypothetical protein
VSQRRGKAEQQPAGCRGGAASLGPDQGEVPGFWADPGAREAGGSAWAAAVAGKCAPAHDRRRAVEAQAAKKPPPTRCASGGRVLGNWCRSTARIMPGSKSGAQVYAAGVYRRCHRAAAGTVVCAHETFLPTVKPRHYLSATASRWPSTATNTASFGSTRSDRLGKAVG